jgi:hypothetical protein
LDLDRSASGARRYLLWFALALMLSFGLVWGWVAVAPMAFMDTEYAAWRAKLAMLQRCDLGEVMVLGDSRPAADILPERLPVRTDNLSMGGAKAIEALSLLRRALACPAWPRLVIISLDPGHFSRPDMFWERSVRFGIVTAAEVAELRGATRQTGDWSVYGSQGLDLVPLRVREWLYRVRFPPLYFSSLAHGGGAARWWRNQRFMDAVVAGRGHYYFGTDPGNSVVTLDGHMDAFRPLPVLDFYFDRLLATLDRAGIEAWFVAMPFNQTTWLEVKPALLAGFTAYLAGYERRYRHFHVISPVMPHWPDRFFGDMFSHLNPMGAERFSDLLGQRLQAAPPSTQNEAQKGWLSETGAEAPDKVVPISKRGS